MTMWESSQPDTDYMNATGQTIFIPVRKIVGEHISRIKDKSTDKSSCSV